MTNEAQMKIRLPVELREAMEKLAKENNRSMNAEIVARLQRSLSPDGTDDRGSFALTPAVLERFSSAVAQKLTENGDIFYLTVEGDAGQAVMRKLYIPEAETLKPAKEPTTKRIPRTPPPKRKP